jgi:hypothetical protein
MFDLRKKEGRGMTGFVSVIYQGFPVKIAPGICGQCADHHYYGDELSDGKPYACGLMVEAMEAGHTVGSCAHFRFGACSHKDQMQREIDAIRKNQEAHGIIDAETKQAAMGIRGAAAAIQDTIFADREPFDPAKFAKDVYV